jgi:hypothetical protein
MSSFKTRVEKLIKRKILGDIINIEYGKSAKGVNFAIVVNRVVWYGVHIVLELYSYNNDDDFDIFKKSEHLTLEGALEKAKDCNDDCK